MKKLDSIAWVSALVLLAVAAMACSTGEQQKAEPAAEQTRQPEAGAAAPERPTEAIDPVCGMPVTTASEFRAKHEGEVYYFCSAACAEAFAQNPAAYLKAEEPDVPSEG